jgi:predicted nucleic acid-binding protein
MAIILDAHVIIRGVKGTFNLQQWVAARPDEQFEVAAVTELWHVVERATGAHRAKPQQCLQTILASLSVIPYTVETAHEHARIWQIWNRRAR